MPSRRRPLLRALHIASLIYAIVIELVPWPPCPLTVAETWLESRAGVEPARGPFLVRVLDGIVYSNLPVWVVVGGAALVTEIANRGLYPNLPVRAVASGAVLIFTGILFVYLQRYLRRSACGQW